MQRLQKKAQQAIRLSEVAIRSIALRGEHLAPGKRRTALDEIRFADSLRAALDRCWIEQDIAVA